MMVGHFCGCSGCQYLTSYFDLLLGGCVLIATSALVLEALLGRRVAHAWFMTISVMK